MRWHLRKRPRVHHIAATFTVPDELLGRRETPGQSPAGQAHPEKQATTWRLYAEGDRICVRSITAPDGTEMRLPGSWAEVLVENPDEVSLALRATPPDLLDLFRGAPS